MLVAASSDRNNTTEVAHQKTTEVIKTAAQASRATVMRIRGKEDEKSSGCKQASARVTEMTKMERNDRAAATVRKCDDNVHYF